MWKSSKCYWVNKKLEPFCNLPWNLIQDQPFHQTILYTYEVLFCPYKFNFSRRHATESKTVYSLHTPEGLQDCQAFSSQDDIEGWKGIKSKYFQTKKQIEPFRIYHLMQKDVFSEREKSGRWYWINQQIELF